MHRIWGLLFGIVLLGILILTAVSPVPGLNWWLPVGASSYSNEIDLLYYAILWLVTFFYVLTEAILVYNMFRFAGPDRKAQFTHGSHKLEMVWTAVPAVILILVAVVQISVWADIKYPTHLQDKIAKGESFLQVEIAARQWEFRIRYPSPDRLKGWDAAASAAEEDYKKRLPERHDDVFGVNDLHVWKGQKVLVFLKTRDVGHAIFIPNIRVKQDALPGKTIPVWFEPTIANTKKVGDQWKIGHQDGEGDYNSTYDFDMVCTQYCGTRHSLMRGKLFVHKDKKDFQDWLATAQQENQRKQVAAK